LAGNGLGNDGAALSEAQRARWRKQSRDWLLADLAVWRRILANGSDNDRELTRRMFTYWEVDPDLAAMREPGALEKLPAVEREQCQELWYQVSRLRDTARQQGSAPHRDEARMEQRAALIAQRRLKEARVMWQEDLESDPADHDAWNGYPELCLFLGHDDDFRRARRALLVRFANTANPFVAERAGRACLLVPASGVELLAEVALVQRAVMDNVHEEWPRAYFEFAKGLGAYRQGKWEEAATIMRGDASNVLGPAPGLVLAMSLEKSSRQQEAREALAAAVLEYDWRKTHMSEPGSWMYQTLRREAESDILQNLTEFLEGTYQPQENSERLALLGICQFEDRWGAAARLFADALAADPSLADRLTESGLRRMSKQERSMDPGDLYRSSSRFGAARCAVLASSGLGSDCAQISEAERTDMRKQAIQWLQADLEVWKKLLVSDSPAQRDMGKSMLSRWESESDLAGFRDPEALAKLSEQDSAACRELWSSLNAALNRPEATESTN
jgi:serine/threonine-protein kinase